MITHDWFLSLLDELDFGATSPRNSFEWAVLCACIADAPAWAMSLLSARARWPVALALMTPYINYENHIYK